MRSPCWLSQASGQLWCELQYFYDLSAGISWWPRTQQRLNMNINKVEICFAPDEVTCKRTHKRTENCIFGLLRICNGPKRNSIPGKTVFSASQLTPGLWDFRPRNRSDSNSVTTGGRLWTSCQLHVLQIKGLLHYLFQPFVFIFFPWVSHWSQLYGALDHVSHACIRQGRHISLFLFLWVFILKEVMYKLPAVLKWLEAFSCCRLGSRCLPAASEGWYPMFYIFKPRERQNVSSHEGWRHGRDCFNVPK